MRGILLYILLVIALTAILTVLILQYRIEVRPATAFVYNNIWTGKTKCALAGTVVIVPGIHKALESEVSLKNEAENPDNVTLITGDGIELEVDYIIRRLQVGYPDMGDNPDKNLLKEAAIKAVTAIEYAKRRDKILTRVVATYQAALEKRSVNDLFPDYDPTKPSGDVCKIDHLEMTRIEEEVNGVLKEDMVTKEWGFWVETDFEDCNLPEVVRKAREEGSSAKIAGKAIRDKADEAGVSPTVLVIADAISAFLKK